MCSTNSIKSRILAVVLLVIMLFTSLIGSNMMSVKADSSDRIKAFVNMGAGKQSTDMDLNDLNLTEQDLRFLGVYISNFFVPFGTELGSGSVSSEDGEDVLTMNKEDIKNALKTLSFSDALASSLTENLIGLSRSSATAQELKLYVSKSYQKDLVRLGDKDAKIPLNTYTMYTCMLGGLPDLINIEYGNKKNDTMKGVINKDYTYGYFAYESGSDIIPVFDFTIDGSKLTASMAAFYKCLESVDVYNGYGFNFFDLTKEEAGDNFTEKVDNIAEDGTLAKMTAYGTTVNVDCFGNILFMGGNHQFVAVPGCMNPYTWVAVDKEGNDLWKGLGGNVYNMINIPSMSMYEIENKLFKKYGTHEDSDRIVKGTFNTKELAKKMRSTVPNKGSREATVTLGNFKMRLFRGSSENTCKGAFNIFGGTKIYDVVKRAENGFVANEGENAHNYYQISSIDKKINLYGRNISGNQYISTNTAKTKNARNLKVFDTFIYIDDLGAAHWDNSGDAIDFSTFNPYSYTTGKKQKSNSKEEGETTSGGDLSTLRGNIKSWGNSDSNGYTNTFSNITNGKMSIPGSEVSQQALIGIYVTYLYSAAYDSSSSDAKASTIGDIGFRMNSSRLPNIPDVALVLSSEASTDMMLTSIRDWVYYLLHPKEGVNYFKIWLSNKVNGFLLGWHDNMVGTNGSGSINGTTKYRGFSGYVTTPELTDLPWTDSLLNTYNSIIPFLIIIMLLIMLGAYVVGTFSLQKAIIGFVIFALCISIPPIAINSTVGTANRFSSSLYGEKFTYWALVQHEAYSTKIDEAASGSSYSNYLKTLYDEKTRENQGSESIMLKWQAPKKMASLMLTDKDESALSGLNSTKLLDGLLNKAYSGESYTSDPDSVYLYRSYIDIANFSRYIHRGLVNDKQPVNMTVDSRSTKYWSSTLKKAFNNFNSVYKSDRVNGYANLNKDGSSDGNKKSILRVKLPVTSKLVNEQLGKKGKIDELKINQYVGINQDAFNFSIPMFNVGEEGGLKFKDDAEISENGVNSGGLATENFSTKNYTSADFSSLAAFGLMSENPFYYFSWYLYETGLTEETAENEGYKNLLLEQDNAGFFYNTEGNNEMKDFMDMRSLFTYTIPYLKECNDLVREWDEVYGVFLYEGVPHEEGHANDSDIKDNPELKQKYWHNLNVARLYNMYSPWVDIMYDCSYAEPETIKFMGEKYLVSDPLNPSSYPASAGRPMIFSHSEMTDYGLDESDLTKAERLILECNEGMQERMFKLLNYHTFNDVVLNTASAMNCAFEFNETFSENSIVGANHNIYPQAFELKDFSYDAFLRFILSNTTGDSMVVDKGENFYDNIVDQSSMTTIIVLLLLDFIAMYVVPGLRIFFIVGIFLLGVLIILAEAFKVDDEQKYIKRVFTGFFKPILQFLLVSCGMSLVISLFMGEGHTDVTGETSASISMGDPVMVMLVMIVINVAVVILYFKILRGVLADIRRTGGAVVTFIGGIAGSVGDKLKGGSSGNSTGAAGSGSGGGSSGVAQEKVSPRAENRGANTKSFNEKQVREVYVTSKSDDSYNRNDDSVSDKKKFGLHGSSTSKKSNDAKSKDIENKIKEGYEKIKKDDKK